MKMISSTSITSMNGVTLISCALGEIVVSVRAETHGHRRYSAGARHAACAPRVEVAADESQHRGRGVGDQRPVAGGRAREHVVDDDRRDRRDQAERGREQRLGDAGRDHREIGGLRLRRCR